jgi:hypothetical protein
LIIACTILHNLCIAYGDNGEELSDEQEDEEGNATVGPQDEDEPYLFDESGTEREIRVRRLNEILATFNC